MKSVRDALFSQALKAAVEAYKKANPPKLAPDAPENVEQVNNQDVPRILDYINSARKSAHVGTVKLDSKLCEVARYRATKMMEWGFVNHDIPNVGEADNTLRQFRVPLPDLIGENATTYEATESALSAHQRLMASEGHKAIILNPRYTRVGIGIAIDHAGAKWLIEIFASP